MPITIKDVKTILIQPLESDYQPTTHIIVKVITSEPGLYGIGCATFTQRFHAVKTAIDEHLTPLVIGRDVSRIEDIFQMSMVNSYWRNGPVLNNAISGIDQALWDIKGKMAGMPVYDLLGGKCREAAACYSHAGGDTKEACLESVQEKMAAGYSHVRVQMGGYGGKAEVLKKTENAQDGAYYNPKEYMRRHVEMFHYLRENLGFEVELLHDIHERLSPIDTINYAKDLEDVKLFFLEDALAPEDIAWFRQLRNQCATPLSMGELFNNPLEWRTLVQERLIDFMRMHVSQMGGISPARHAVSFAQAYNVRTAWHGPPDTSAVGHAANLHLDLWAPNFGIQEWCEFPELIYEMFPGLPEVRDGYMYANDKPGLGIDINEELAAKYPAEKNYEIKWTQTRLPDGSLARP
ncbi:MAG: starvation-sensing protein RspA [Lentisphaeria bacterium]|nr:starvation-sensing protein RspA [Lentisphaeria bacterium]NQZ68258.1 starvation-sensing protein RspA [Lentisphaeria bacterium]